MRTEKRKRKLRKRRPVMRKSRRRNPKTKPKRANSASRTLAVPIIHPITETGPYFWLPSILPFSSFLSSVYACYLTQPPPFSFISFPHFSSPLLLDDRFSCFLSLTILSSFDEIRLWGKNKALLVCESVFYIEKGHARMYKAYFGWSPLVFFLLLALFPW